MFFAVLLCGKDADLYEGRSLTIPGLQALQLVWIRRWSARIDATRTHHRGTMPLLSYRGLVSFRQGKRGSPGSLLNYASTKLGSPPVAREQITEPPRDSEQLRLELEEAERIRAAEKAREKEARLDKERAEINALILKAQYAGTESFRERRKSIAPERKCSIGPDGPAAPRRPSVEERQQVWVTPTGALTTLPDQDEVEQINNLVKQAESARENKGRRPEKVMHPKLTHYHCCPVVAMSLPSD